MGAYIGDALVQREQHAALAPDEIEHHVVRRADQALVATPVGFMPCRSKGLQKFDRGGLVELEPHAGLRGRRLSSRASSAAYARAASMWMGSSVGELRRISSRPSPSARLSRMTVTSTRVPLAQSCPPQTLGSLVR